MAARDGFSVMEALAATALLATAMIPIYDMIAALHRAGLRLGEATEAPFIEATALTLLDAGEPYGSQRSAEGSLVIRGWQVSWRRGPVTAEQTAGAAYGLEMSDLWLEELELVLTGDNYSQVSKHAVLVWRPRFEDLESYLAQADQFNDLEGMVDDATD